jgi:hypothetical protein
MKPGHAKTKKKNMRGLRQRGGSKRHGEVAAADAPASRLTSHQKQIITNNYPPGLLGPKQLKATTKTEVFMSF